MCKGCIVAVGIVGGTGPLGKGLALRFAAAGVASVVGSRDEERARQVVSDLLDPWRERGLDVRGSSNEDAARCEVVFMATPWESALETMTPLAGDLSGKLVVCVANALVRQGKEFQAVFPPRGSVAAWLQSALPECRVAAACHHLPARMLRQLDHEIDSDVLVCADEAADGDAAGSLISSIPGLRSVYVGSLASAAAVEAFTAVLATLNVRHRSHATVKITGLVG